MDKRQKIFSNVYLFSTILLIGFSFEFFIRNDFFLGSVLIFAGILNLISFQTISRRVSAINILLTLFNGILSYFVSDNYGIINYKVLYFVWTLLTLFFLVICIIQIRIRVRSIRKRKKIKKRFE